MEQVKYLKIMQDRQVELGYTNKYIAGRVQHSEKTVSRFFSGETKEPDIVLFYEIAAVLDLSVDALCAGYKAPMGSNIITTLQEDVDRLTAEVDRLTFELTVANSEIGVLEDKASSLIAERDLLRLKLEHKDEIILHKDKIIALHDLLQQAQS